MVGLLVEASVRIYPEHANVKWSRLRNAARDAWVARQRAKKDPLSWEEIYDEGVRLAAKRGWDMPGSAKALEEAYRRHLQRQRPAKEE